MSYWVNPDIEEIVAGLPGVRAEVIETAHRGARLLRRNINSSTGAMAASVESEALGAKDAWFGLNDEGAMGYNYGHHNTWSDEPVPGSHVIAKTIGGL
ncbi:hypothetical protein GCM10022252_19630 [Streptosporangium oxazolinicum]|uniref:HK97 gp10 family phage protein n=1 Tax=Streptosporangium oxazolinicum TaxID=909287 RepID=A0ABP8ANI7_9ACTN